MLDLKSNFYYTINDWIQSNPEHTFYVYASQQKDVHFYDFCLAVTDNKKIPVIITNVSGLNKEYPANLKMAMTISDDVRLYESAKLAMTTTLVSRAKLFIKTNGGILWTR